MEDAKANAPKQPADITRHQAKVEQVIRQTDANNLVREKKQSDKSKLNTTNRFGGMNDDSD